MKVKISVLAVLALVIFAFCSPAGQDVTFVKKEHQIDVMFDGQHFTTYLFGPDLAKPILYPVRSPSGIVMNRGFPLQTIEGESRDHPHHIGFWFACDEVNGNGFWNNTDPPPQIRHVQVESLAEGTGKGVLSTIMHWIDKNGESILEENRSTIFYPGVDMHTIDFVITLTAKDTTVVIHDTKEGLFAIRVADWLKEEGGSGRYLNSEGAETEEKVWGKRAHWVRLEGEKDGKRLGIAILNHPRSNNYPTYWMARGYGLFSANPIGQYVYQKYHGVEDPEPYNLTLHPGESARFLFRMLIYEGQRTKQQFDEAFDEYSKDK